MYTLKTYSWGYLLPCFFTYSLLRCCYFSFTSDSHPHHIHPSFSLMTEIKESLQSGAQSTSQIFIRYVKASGNSSFTPSYWMQVSPLHQTFCNQYFTRLLKVLWLYRQCTAATSTIHRVLLPLSLKSWKRSEYLKKNKLQFPSPGLSSDSSLHSYFLESTLFIYNWHISPVPSPSILK